VWIPGVWQRWIVIQCEREGFLGARAVGGGKGI